MPLILKTEKKSVLKKRNVTKLVVKVETVPENRVNLDFEETNLLKTRNESFFESVWPGKIKKNCKMAWNVK